MAEKETRNKPKDLIEATPEEVEKIETPEEIIFQEKRSGKLLYHKN